MHTRREFAAKILGSGAIPAVALATVAVRPATAQGYRFNPEHRRPVDATLRDLEEVGSRNTYNQRERERYDNAIHHLRQFAERLHEGGFFDKGKLDEAITDLRNVVEKNQIHERGRELLTRDLMELRRLREHYEDRYRYQH